MAILIFRLRNVPDDEAEEIRQLLNTRHIEFYETTAGNWGISMPGIWLNNDDDAPEAKALIKRYQAERSHNARENYQQQKNAGEHRTIVDSLKERPLASIGIIVFCLLIVYFSTTPFLKLINAG